MTSRGVSHKNKLCVRERQVEKKKWEGKTWKSTKKYIEENDPESETQLVLMVTEGKKSLIPILTKLNHLNSRGVQYLLIILMLARQDALIWIWQSNITKIWVRYVCFLDCVHSCSCTVDNRWGGLILSYGPDHLLYILQYKLGFVRPRNISTLLPVGRFALKFLWDVRLATTVMCIFVATF